MRADAERSVATILDAAVELLSGRPEAGMAEIARAAGVSRQTLYAHFASREALVMAVGRRALDEALAAFAAAKLEDGPPAAALERLIEASFASARRHRLYDIRFPAMTPEQERAGHAPLLAPLEALIRRGQRSGAFDPDASPTWLCAAFIALSHAAAEEISSGRLQPDEAVDVLTRSTLRTFGAPR